MNNSSRSAERSEFIISSRVNRAWVLASCKVEAFIFTCIYPMVSAMTSYSSWRHGAFLFLRNIRLKEGPEQYFFLFASFLFFSSFFSFSFHLVFILGITVLLFFCILLTIFDWQIFFSALLAVPPKSFARSCDLRISSNISYIHLELLYRPGFKSWP